MRILFDSRKAEYKTPFGTLVPGGACEINIEIPCDCGTKKAEIVILNEDKSEKCRFSMKKKTEDGTYEKWGTVFSEDTPGLYFYHFHIYKSDSDFDLLKYGNCDTNIESGSEWQMSVISEKYPIPDYAKGAVMYQIFPDRFSQSGTCDLKDKLEPYWIHKNKDEKPAWRDKSGNVLYNDFYGGNFAGISEKLTYLHDLGVDIIYFNPVFMAWSSHRYDTYDYKRIDPMLGTEDDFRQLCGKAHSLGMKIILDGVFNHTGKKSIYFEKAISDPKSNYRGWYLFDHYPDKYKSWWNVNTLPCTDKNSKEFRDYIINDEDSVIAHWLKLGADGWRLDVVDELPDDFLALLRKRVKEVKPDSLLIGEVWEDASNKSSYGERRRYFTDRQLDSVMNYPWQKAILRYVRGDEDGAALGETVMALAENYPDDVLQSVMNIISTHDTARALNSLVDPTDASREELMTRELTSAQVELGKKLLKMAAFIQFMLPGMACIYYGDEAGLTGYRDPLNRRFYPWGKEDEDLRKFYHDLATLKKRSKPVVRGNILVERDSGGIFEFKRTYGNEEVLAICNRSSGNVVIEPTGDMILRENVTVTSEGKISIGPIGMCAISSKIGGDNQSHVL